MPILSNQGRTVPELPSISPGDIGNSDLLIIQNIASNSTKRSSVLDFCVKSANLITSFNNLKFSGAGNSFTGSLNNTSDAFSIISAGIPNVARRFKLLNYLEIGESNSNPSALIANVNEFLIDQSSKSSTTTAFYGNSFNSQFIIQGYPSGLSINSNTPVTAGQITATTGFTGNLTGNVNYSGIGQSYFFNLNVDNQLTVAYTTILNADINGGTIDNCVIGNTLPTRITGSKILANNGIKGNLTGNVTGDLVGNVAGNLYGNVVGNVTGDVTGNLYGNVDVLSVGALGTSQFWNLNVNNSLTSPNGQFVTVNIDGGTIDNTVIGSSLPKQITGTTITATAGITGNLTGNVTGNVVGNVTGNITGNITGNVTATVVAADTFIGGEFTGTNVSATGFNGDLSGDVTGDIKSPTGQIVLDNGPGDDKDSRFYGTSSYALSTLSSSYALKAVTVDGAVSDAAHATLADLATSAYTSSYVLQFKNIKTNALAYYNGNELTSLPSISYQPLDSTYHFLKLSGSNAVNRIVVDSKATNNFGQSGLVLSINPAGVLGRTIRYKGQPYGPEYWNFQINQSGSFNLQAITNSYNFNNTVYKSSAIPGYPVFGLVNPMKFINNNIYFWGDPASYSTPSRDGAIGIGVTPTDDSVSTPSNLKSRFQIDIFSSSLTNINKGAWSTPATVRHHQCAILVRYGSGSLSVDENGDPIATTLNTTFYVSSSGNVYARGNLYVNRGITGSVRGIPFITVNNKPVSFWGTGSHAVSSSFSSIANSSLTSLTSSYTRLIPYHLYSSTTYGSRDASTSLRNGDSYFYPINDNPSGPARTKALPIPVGKRVRWFKINGAIISGDPTEEYKIFGVSVNDNTGTLPDNSTFCSWGWNTAVKGPAGSPLSFTIEGPLDINGGGTIFFKVWATAGVPAENMKGYVILYYDN